MGTSYLAIAFSKRVCAGTTPDLGRARMPRRRFNGGSMAPIALACCVALLQVNGANALVFRAGVSLRLARSPTHCEFLLLGNLKHDREHGFRRRSQISCRLAAAFPAKQLTAPLVDPEHSHAHHVIFCRCRRDEHCWVFFDARRADKSLMHVSRIRCLG